MDTEERNFERKLDIIEKAVKMVIKVRYQIGNYGDGPSVLIQESQVIEHELAAYPGEDASSDVWMDKVDVDWLDSKCRRFWGMAIPLVPETSSLRQQVRNYNMLDDMGAEEMVPLCNNWARGGIYETGENNGQD